VQLLFLEIDDYFMNIENERLKMRLKSTELAGGTDK